MLLVEGLGFRFVVFISAQGCRGVLVSVWPSGFQLPLGFSTPRGYPPQNKVD